MADDFWERYKHPKWQEKRLRIMERDGFACVRCGENDATLNVHHGYYERGREPWEYLDETLHTLCEPCHKEIQAILSALRSEIALFDPEKLHDLLALVSLIREQCSDGPATQLASIVSWLYGITQRDEWIDVHRAVAEMSRDDPCQESTIDNICLGMGVSI